MVILFTNQNLYGYVMNLMKLCYNFRVQLVCAWLGNYIIYFIFIYYVVWLYIINTMIWHHISQIVLIYVQMWLHNYTVKWKQSIVESIDFNCDLSVNHAVKTTYILYFYLTFLIFNQLSMVIGMEKMWSCLVTRFSRASSTASFY